VSAIEDLKPFDFFPFDRQPSLRAIGWLDHEPIANTRQIQNGFFEKLFELLVNPWQPFASAGYHDCSHCRFTGGPKEIRMQNRSVRIGNANLFVPADDCVFVAPSSVIHYIDAHEYCPPRVFQDAVLSCPEMRSMEYFRALRRHVSIKALESPPADLTLNATLEDEQADARETSAASVLKSKSTPRSP
jgi:hypothetical protein